MTVGNPGFSSTDRSCSCALASGLVRTRMPRTSCRRRLCGFGGTSGTCPATAWLCWSHRCAGRRSTIAVLITLDGSGQSEQRPDAALADPAYSSPTTAALLEPVAAENVLFSAVDEGYVQLDDGTTARRQRLEFVDTVTWRNPATRASLTWSVPREEVHIVPVQFQ